MAEIYVRKTGNDSTGDGSTATPYLTITKALTVAAAGDSVVIGGGTYSESNVGGGRFEFSGDYSSGAPLVVCAETEAEVVVTGTTHEVAATGRNIAFRKLTFANAPSAQGSARLYGTPTDIWFLECHFRTATIATDVRRGLYSSPGSAQVGSRIKLVGCTFSFTGPFRSTALSLMAPVSDIEVTRSTLSAAGYALRLDSGIGVNISGNHIENTRMVSGEHALLLGADAATGKECTGVISGNYVRAERGHSLVVGAGCHDVDVIGNTVISGNDGSVGLGIVIKQSEDVRVQRNVVVAGSASAVYAKATRRATFLDNIIHVPTAAGVGFRVDSDTQGGFNVSDNITFRRNTIHATAGSVFDWSSTDSGGSVCDENVYDLSGSATIGTIRGASVVTIRELRSAWAAYNSNNDRNSRIGSRAAVYAGAPLATL